MTYISRTFFFLLIINKLSAQISGTVSVPGTYSTLAAAISDLNTQGVNGAVTVQISAGYTETVTAGGFSLTATGTSTSPITFMKNGAGVNPLLLAYAGGTAVPNSALQDGIFRLIGSDYITIDGIDLLDPNTSNPATMEFGYGLFKVSAANGCQNNIIRNCTITLNRINNANGSGPASPGSRGIDMVNATSQLHTSSISTTVTTGANSNNKFYSNVIQNCNIGISLFGYTTGSPYLNTDTDNEVGGSSLLFGNTIIDFGGGGSTNPATGIFTVGQYNFLLSHNYVLNNTGSGVNHGGILRGINTTNAPLANFSVTHNTVTVHSGSSTSELTAILNTSGSTIFNNVNISNNLVANCTYTAAISGNFRGIASGPGFTISVTSNTIVNNSTSAATGSYYGINTNGSTGSFYNLSDNLIDVGNFDATSTSISFGAILNTSGNSNSTLTISNNIIQNANFNGAVGGVGIGYMIYNSGNINTTNISGNNFSNLSIKTSGNVYLIHDYSNTRNTNVTGNYISGGFSKTVQGNSFFGYYNISNTGGSGSGISTFSGNNFSNITLTGATTAYGYYDNMSYDQALSINNNTISGISTGSALLTGIHHSFGNSSSSIHSNVINILNGAGIVYGIRAVSSPSLLTVRHNTVYSLSSTGPDELCGLYLFGGGLMNVSHNKIYDVSGTHASSTVRGIFQGSVTSLSLFNNLVGDLRAASGNSTDAVCGVYLSGGNAINMFNNTVFLSASSSGANFGSSALYSTTVPLLNLRNNILINTSLANGSGKTIAYQRSSATLTTYSSTSNNNIFYAGATPSATNCIFYDGTNIYPSISSYTSAMGVRDNFSFSENTAFTSTVGSSSNFLHISNSPPSVAESNGISIAGLDDDVDNQIRYGILGYTGSGSGVDIGADEYNGTFIDLLAPVITHTALGTTCSTGDRTVTAVISDQTGVPLTGSLVPRIYFKKNAGAYVSDPGVLASGTASSGIWNFTISSSALGSIAINDVITYFIVAQDVNSPVNVGAHPSSGLVAASVTLVTGYPTSPHIYTVTSLAGTYSVGAGGSYSTLSDAAYAYNISCLSGPITFVLTDVLYSAAENFPITFENNPFANITNSLLIRPAASVTAVITPTVSNALSVFKFLDARYISTDGINAGGSALEVVNTNTNSGCAGIWLASSSSGCNNLALKNMLVMCGTNIPPFTYGVVAGTNSTIPVSTAGFDNDNITIEGLTILRCFYGIAAAGTNSTVAGGINDWTIRNNQIGPVTSHSLNNLGLYGMLFQNAQNLACSNNTISNIISAAGYLYGISLGAGVSSSTVQANTISAISYTGTSAFGAIGIDIQTGSASSNLLIQNNMISDLKGRGANLFTNGGYAGIRVGSAAATGGVKFYNNSIAMNHSNTVGGASNASVTACMYFAATSSNIELVNNLLYSNIQFTNSAARTFAIYSAAAPAAFSVMNYNNYYVTGPQGVLALVGTTTVNTLANLQSAFGGNAASQNIAPVFTSTTDLHLDPLNNFSLDNLGTPVLGLGTDIDGQLRNAGTPDIGADEFTTPNCSTVTAASIFTPTTFTICSGQNISLSRSNYTFLPGIQHTWQVGSSPGGPYTVVATSTTTSFLSPTLTPGNYYFVAAVTCSFTNQTAISNSASVTVNPFPVVSVSPTFTTICAGNPVYLTANGALNFTWTPSSSLSSNNGSFVTATPNFTTTYQVTGSNPGGCIGSTNSATVVVNVMPAPGGLTVSATPTLLCQGGSVNMQAVATSSVYTVTPISFSPVPTPTSGVGTLCSNGNMITSMSGGWLDDGDWYVVPIPFTFQFFGTNYTGCAVSINGFLTLGSTVPLTYNGFGVNLPSTIAGRPSIGAVYGDLDFSNTGTITVFTSGVSPNRRFVVNWMNARYETSNSGTVTTQVILYEGTQVVEVHTTRNTAQYAASEGIQNAAGTVAYMVPGRNNTTFNISNDAYRWSPTINYLWAPSTNLSSTSTRSTVASNIQSNIIYTVSAIAVDGCVMSRTVGITVNPSPTLSIAGSTTEICAGASVSLSASGANNYNWSTGAGTTSISVNPTITTIYNVSGTHTLNSCTGNSSFSITVYPNPTISVTGNPFVCSGMSTTLTATGANTYLWSDSSTGASVAITPATNTVYSVIGTTSPGGCVGTEIKTITVYTNPTVSISGSTLVCSGKNATLSATGANTYSWNTGAGTQSIFPIVSANTVFTVTGTNSLGGCTGTASHSISANSSPTLSVLGTTVICAGQSAVLTVSGANTYLWSNGSTSAVITVTPPTTTLYTVTGTSAGNGCSANGSAQVSIVNPPAIIISGNKAICPGVNANLTASGAGIYQWSNGSTIPMIVVSPTITSTYSVTGIASAGCTGSAAVEVTVHPLPSASITASPSATICSGESAELTAVMINGNSMIWSTGAVGNVLQVSPVSSTIYSVQMSSSATTCTANLGFELVVDACTGITVPLKAKNLRVFPNPFIAEFQIDYQEKETVMIELFDPMGRTLFVGSLHQGINTFDMKKYKQGVYYLRILTGEPEVIKLVME